MHWHPMDSQFVLHLRSIWIQLAINWHSNDSQVALNWKTIGIPLEVESNSIWAAIEKCSIGSGLDGSKFGKSPESGRNRGLSLVESRECWLLIGRELPQEIFQGKSLLFWTSANPAIFDLNWQSIDIGCWVNSSQASGPRSFPSIEGNSRGPSLRDELGHSTAFRLANWQSIGITLRRI